MRSALERLREAKHALDQIDMAALPSPAFLEVGDAKDAVLRAMRKVSPDDE